MCRGVCFGACRLGAFNLVGSVVSFELAQSGRPVVGLWQVPAALAQPRRILSRVEDVPLYGWSLVVLLLAVTAVGYMTIETGLIDREVDRTIEAQIAQLEQDQVDVVERSTLIRMIADLRKQGEFLQMMARVQAVVLGPVATLATILIIPAMLYGIVALTGKKPEWHTLLTICVFASFADVLGSIARLGLMLRYHTLYVDTSLGLLVRTMDTQPGVDAQALAGLEGFLSGVDPFRIWFWLVVAVGLSATSQLRGWRAWLPCTMFWFLAAFMRAGAAAASVVVATGAGAAGSGVEVVIN